MSNSRVFSTSKKHVKKKTRKRERKKLKNSELRTVLRSHAKKNSNYDYDPVSEDYKMRCSQRVYLKSANQCSCKQCIERRSLEEKYGCRPGSSKSSRSKSLLLDNKECRHKNTSNCNPEVSRRACSGTIPRKKLSQKKLNYKSQHCDDGYCECEECIGTPSPVEESDSSINLRTSSSEEALSVSKSCPTNDRWAFPKRKKKARKSKSLLKYVLKKKQKHDEGSSSNECNCCSKCMRKLMEFIKDEISKQKVKPKKRRRHDSETAIKRRRSHTNMKPTFVRRNKSETTMPHASIGAKTSQRHKVVEDSMANDSLYSSETDNCKSGYDVTCEEVQNFVCSRRAKIKSREQGKKIKLSSSSCAIKKQNEKSKEKKEKIRHWKMGYNDAHLSSRCKPLSFAKTKQSTIPQRKRLVKNDVRKRKDSKKEIEDGAPPPSAGNNYELKRAKFKKIHCKKKESFSSMDANASCRADEDSIDDECDSFENVDFSGAPAPSARVPTFIAMVKTAIRDLEPYGLTGKAAISKFIRIRYNVRNDCLLSYVLKWMCDMDVLRKRCGQYKFCGKRIIKKETIACVSPCRRQVTCRNTRPCERPYPCRAPRRNCKKRRRNVKGAYYYRKACNNACCTRRRRVYRRKKKRRPPCQAMCTCDREVNAMKNRIRVGTRYVRKKGKIYRQEEYI